MMAENNKNFSVAEEHLLVDLVEQYKCILENKRSDAVTWKCKIEMWGKLAETFASQSGEHRHWKALRDKYENLKRKSKLELAAEKRETYGTGGAPAATNSVSIISEQMCSLIGESATGLSNTYDNDANNNRNSPPTKFSSKETLHVSNDKSMKTKAVQFHEDVKVHADEITKLDLENLQILKSLKNDIANKESLLKQTSPEPPQRQESRTENVDVNNFRQRQTLFDTIRELETSSAAKLDEIQDSINLSIKRNKLENELNQKRFDELREYFDTLYERAMGFANHADPDRWREMLQS